METALIISGLFFFAALSFVRREYAVYLIVLLLPSYQIRFSAFGIPLTFLECLILISGAAFFVQTVTAGRLKEFWLTHLKKTENIFVFIFLLAATVSVFVSPERIAAAGIFKAYFLEAVLFYLLVRAEITTPEKQNRLWQTIAFLVTYLSLFGLYQFLTLEGLPVSWWGVNVSGRRITSLLNHPNALALVLGPLLAALIFLPKKNWLRILAIVIGLLAFYLTFSRAGWLALLISVTVTGLLTAAKKKILTAATLLVLLLMLLPFSRQKLLELRTGRAATQENRYILWSAAADIITHRPLGGAGLMGFHKYYKSYPLGPDRVVQNYPHNFFLNFWVETGLLGFIAICGILFFYYKKIRRLLAEHSLYVFSLLAAMTVIVLHGLVDVPYFKNDLAVLFWLIFALPWLPGVARNTKSD